MFCCRTGYYNHILVEEMSRTFILTEPVRSMSTNKLQLTNPSKLFTLQELHE